MSSSGSVNASIAFRAASSATLRDEHLLWCVLGPARMVLDGRLELGGDAGLLQDRLELLGFGDVLGERDLNHVRHRAVSSVTGTGALSARRTRTTLDELRDTPLLEGDGDDIEVSRNDRLGEDRAGLAGDVGPEVPRREMREREQLHAGIARELGRVERRRVHRLEGALPLVLQEGGLVDEQVRATCGFEDGLGRRRVAGDDHRAPGPRRPEHLVGRDGRPVRERDGLAALERAALRPERNAEPVGGLDVELPRAVVLDERVADRRDAVPHGERDEAVVAAVERLPGVELLELVAVGEPAEDPLQRPEQLDEAGRAVDRDRHVAAAKRERLQHPGQPEVVVGVVVGEEDLPEVDQAERRAEQLALRALGAVEEQPLSSAAHEHGGRRPLGGRHRAGGAQEDDVEVHPPGSLGRV